MTIAITGATGQLGRLVIAQLKTRVDPSDIIALARDPARAADLGVAVRAADYARPDTLETALAGVDRLLLISSNAVGERVAQHQAVIDAAKKAGVKLLVYTSLLHADHSVLGLAEEHRQTEAAIRASGVPFVILRNGWYSENYANSIAGALADGTLPGAAGGGKISAAARADYAEAAAVVLAGENRSGTIHELAGDRAFTLAELAAEIGRQAGRAIPYHNLSEADYAAALIGAGVPEGYATMIAGWDIATAAGALFDDGGQLATLIGRPTTPLAVTVAGVIKG